MPLVQPSNDAYDHVLRLRVVRHFTSDPVPDAEVEAVLEAGRWTGSSKNTQDWRFAVVNDPETRSRLAEAGRFTDPVRRAPVTVCLVRTPDGNDFDIGRVAQNLMLAAAARGLGSCPVTLHHTARAAEVLGIPDDHACRFAIAMGYPDEAAERRERAAHRATGGRFPLDDLLWESG
jgi:nitroreductase